MEVDSQAVIGLAWRWGVLSRNSVLWRRGVFRQPITKCSASNVYSGGAARPAERAANEAHPSGRSGAVQSPQVR